MENVAEALKMAAGVLIFIVCLAITMNAFGEVRKTSHELLNYQDREYYQELNPVDWQAGRTQRVVSAESIIPTIYKAYQENYKIVFTKAALDSTPLYTKNREEIYRIDLENETRGTDEEIQRFLKALLYAEGADDEYYVHQGIIFPTNPDNALYNRIKGRRFKESLGIYYQEEIEAAGGEVTKPKTNRNLKRVITYDVP